MNTARKSRTCINSLREYYFKRISPNRFKLHSWMKSCICLTSDNISFTTAFCKIDWAWALKNHIMNLLLTTHLIQNSFLLLYKSAKNIQGLITLVLIVWEWQLTSLFNHHGKKNNKTADEFDEDNSPCQTHILQQTDKHSVKNLT